jgi:hypothetical protein
MRRRIRHHHFGEGEYAQSERTIQALLADAGHPEALNVPLGLTGAPAQGALAPADGPEVHSPETYVGYARAGVRVAGRRRATRPTATMHRPAST